MSECGLSNLAVCLPEKIFEYLGTLISSPLQFLLDSILRFMTEPVDISIYGPLWAIITYILSLFYGLLVVYVGFNFMFSGHDVVKRENAKDWLKNVIIMMVLVQASFFIYELLVDMGSLLTTGILSLVDEDFFRVSASGYADFALELIFNLVYLLIMLATLILFALRNIYVGLGVVMFPVGIFLYFIPPLRTYGRFILHLNAIGIFITFFDAVIILASSLAAEMPVYSSMKVLVMIAAFLMVNLSFGILLILAWKKTDSALGISKNFKYIAALAA